MIPDKIKVCNITYKVKFKKLKDDFGSHDSGKQEILIAKGLSKEMTKNVFFHELIHAIFFQLGAYDERRNELLVQSLANELDKLFELK